MPFDVNTFASMLDAYEDDYTKTEFIKKHYMSVTGLTILDITQHILPKLTETYNIAELIVYFAKSICKPEHLFAALRCLRDDAYNVVEVIKKVYAGAHLSKADVITLMGYVKDDYNRGEIVKFFVNWFTSADLPDILPAFIEDYQRMEAVKLLHSKGRLSADSILLLSGCMAKEETRVELALFFSSYFTPQTATLFLVMLQSVQSVDSKMLLIEKLSAAISGLESPYELLLAEVQSDEDKLGMLHHLTKLLPTLAPEPSAVLKGFRDENNRWCALHRLSLKRVCNDPESLITLLQHFYGAGRKLKIFVRKVKESEVLPHNLFKALVCFDSDRDRVKALSCFLRAVTPPLSIEDLECALGLCVRESHVKLLSLYRSKHELDAQDIIRLIPLLPAGKEAIKFFRHYGYYETVKECLYGSEWIPFCDAEQDDVPLALIEEEDSESSSSDEEEEEEQEAPDDAEKFDKELKKRGIVMNRYTHILTLEPQLIKKEVRHRETANMFTSLWKHSIRYDMTKHRIMNKKPLCFITIGGVNIVQQSQLEIERIAEHVIKNEEKRVEQLQKLKQQQEKLKVPHSWKDVQVTDSTPESQMCTLCMNNMRCVILLPCGHYHMCAHCTRVIIRSKEQGNLCPFCQQEFTAVSRVFT